MTDETKKPTIVKMTLNPKVYKVSKEDLDKALDHRLMMGLYSSLSAYPPPHKIKPPIT